MRHCAWLVAAVVICAGGVSSPSVAADEGTGSISGVVVGDPAAVSRTTVTLVPDLQEPEARTAHVGADGTYRFDGVAPGRRLMRLGGAGVSWAPGFPGGGAADQYQTNPVVVSAGRAATAPVQHVYEPENIGHIDIVGQEHQQRDFSVWSADDRDSPVIGPNMALTNGFSRFPLGPGRYKVKGANGTWFGGRSFDSATVYDVRPGETVTVTAPVLDGRLIRAYAPLPGVYVSAYAVDDPTEILTEVMTNFRGEAYLYGFDPEQRYKLRAVDPSRRLRPAWLGGASFATAKAVEPDDGFADEWQGIRMQRADGWPPFAYPQESGAATISGTVSGPGKKWTSNGLTLVDAHDENSVTSETYFRSDDTYEFEPIPPGDYKMRLLDNVWVGGRSFTTAKIFHLGAGDVVTEDVEYPLTGILSAQVLNPGGRPVSTVMVEAHTASGPDEIVSRATTDQEGVLQFGRLRLEPLTFRVVDAAGRYVDTWIGGGSSSAPAESYTPATGSAYLPDTYLRPALYPLLAPVVSGDSKVGSTLRADSHGTWSMGDLLLAGQWLRGGLPIAGQVGSTYQLTAQDVGHVVSYRVTASRSGQVSRVAESRQIAVSPAVPSPAAVTPAVGKMSLKLTTSHGATRLRVSMVAEGFSKRAIDGMVLVRERHSSRRVRVAVRDGVATVSLRRLKKGLRRITVSFAGPSGVSIQSRTVKIRVL
jgi:hypothetical protein